MTETASQTAEGALTPVTDSPISIPESPTNHFHFTQAKTSFDDSLDSIVGTPEEGESGTEDAGVETKIPAVEGEPAVEVAEGEEKTTDESEEVPTYTFKSGEKDLDIPRDAIIEVPVDGKPMQVTLEDLRANYSGKVSWNEKFRELSDDKKKFKQDVALVDGKLNKIFKSFSEGKSHVALETLFSMVSPKAKEQAEAAIKSAIEQAEKYAAMSPEERRAAEAEAKLETLTEEQKIREAAAAQKQKDAKFAELVVSKLKTSGMSPQEFQQAWANIEARAKEGQVKLNGIPIEELVDLTFQEALLDRRDRHIQNGISKVDPSLKDDRNLIKSLMEVVPIDMTEEDIADIVRGLLGKDSQPVGDSASDSQAKAKSGTTKAKTRENKEETSSDVSDLVERALGSRLF